MKNRLFFKILFSFMVIICLSVYFLDLQIRNKVKDMLKERIKNELIVASRLVELDTIEQISANYARIKSICDARVTVIDPQGKVIADSERKPDGMENHLNRPEIQEARLKGVGTAIRFSQTLGVDMLYVATSLKTQNRITGYFRLARSLESVQISIERIYQSIFVSMVIVSALAMFIAFVLARRLAAPVQAIEKYTERLRQGFPVRNMILRTSDETKNLADNINYLMHELQNKIRLVNEEKSKLMAALNSINEGILILNREDKIEFVSPALLNILGDQYKDLNDKTLMEAFRNVDLQKAFDQFRMTRKTVSHEVTLDADLPVIMCVAISEIHGYPGEEKVMIVFHDVTKLKKLERSRTDFVANVTHEIRTPLTAIIGYLETFQNGNIENEKDARRFIDIMLKQARRLNRLVEDLMTISKIELGEVKLNHEMINLPDIVNHVLQLLEAKAQAKKVRIDNRVIDRILNVRGDRDRLCQIFVNLLDNAVKFNRDGGALTIDAEQTQESVIVTIADTGIGIPREEIQRMGERFYRVDKTRSRDMGGTGLGLSIVKHLMHAHGGRMEIESQLGQGTKIILHFPPAAV